VSTPPVHEVVVQGAPASPASPAPPSPVPLLLLLLLLLLTPPVPLLLLDAVPPVPLLLLDVAVPLLLLDVVPPVPPVPPVPVVEPPTPEVPSEMPKILLQAATVAARTASEAKRAGEGRIVPERTPAAARDGRQIALATEGGSGTKMRRHG
jgi:hypothetical protein